MKIYVDSGFFRAFTREVLEKKVLEIVEKCIASHKTHDNFFRRNIPSMREFLDCNNSAIEELEMQIIEERYEEIKNIREEYIDWCCQAYISRLIDDVLDEVELIDT